MYKHVDFLLTGVSPTMLHNGRLANPFDPMAKELKKVTSRRNKSEEDQLLIADIEWVSSFYPSEPGEVLITDNKLMLTGYGVPNWPAEQIEAMLQSAAAVHKLGKLFKAGVMCEGYSPIQFGEKKGIADLFHDPKYIDCRGVGVNGKTVMRTRPIFHDWKLKVRVMYLEELLDEGKIETVMDTAGLRIGLSDHRPKYGRFTAEKLNGKG